MAIVLQTQSDEDTGSGDNLLHWNSLLCLFLYCWGSLETRCKTNMVAQSPLPTVDRIKEHPKRLWWCFKNKLIPACTENDHPNFFTCWSRRYQYDINEWEVYECVPDLVWNYVLLHAVWQYYCHRRKCWKCHACRFLQRLQPNHIENKKWKSHKRIVG